MIMKVESKGMEHATADEIYEHSEHSFNIVLLLHGITGLLYLTNTLLSEVGATAILQYKK